MRGSVGVVRLQASGTELKAIKKEDGHLWKYVSTAVEQLSTGETTANHDAYMLVEGRVKLVVEMLGYELPVETDGKISFAKVTLGPKVSTFSFLCSAQY